MNENSNPKYDCLINASSRKAYIHLLKKRGYITKKKKVEPDKKDAYKMSLLF